MRKWRIPALVAVGLVVITLVLEGLVRVFAPQQLIQLRLNAWELDDRYGFKLREDYDTQVNLGDGPVRLITDDHGHRVGSTLSGGEARYRILVLGDSFVEGTAVEYEQTATARLEASLTEALGESVSVVNAGTWGWRPEQYLLREQEELSQSDYDLLVIFLYTGNDIISERLVDFASTVPTYPHPLRVPRNLGTDELIDAVFYPINDFFEARSQLYLFLKYQLEPLRAQAGFTSSSIPDAMYRSEAESQRWSVTGDMAEEMAREGEAHDTPVLFVLIPTRAEVDESYLQVYVEATQTDPAEIDPEQPMRLLRDELEERGLEVLDTSDALARVGQENAWDDVYVSYVHFGANGHAAVAQDIFPEILEYLR